MILTVFDQILMYYFIFKNQTVHLKKKKKNKMLQFTKDCLKHASLSKCWTFTQPLSILPPSFIIWKPRTKLLVLMDHKNSTSFAIQNATILPPFKPSCLLALSFQVVSQSLHLFIISTCRDLPMPWESIVFLISFLDKSIHIQVRLLIF